MRCIRINIKQAAWILVMFLTHNIYSAEQQDQNKLSLGEIKSNNNTLEEQNEVNIQEDLVLKCPNDVECSDLPVQCLDCELNKTCIYGQDLIATCHVKPQVKCIGSKTFDKNYICRYCYQTDHWEHSCELKATCDSTAPKRDIYTTNCTVGNDILCLGYRTFNKRVKCNWTGGYSWSAALILSITAGGLGADRFYLGHWQEAIGKLFSFGGLGVWTLIDVILISLHYLGPADGSLYL